MSSDVNAIRINRILNKSLERKIQLFCPKKKIERVRVLWKNLSTTQVPRNSKKNKEIKKEEEEEE